MIQGVDVHAGYGAIDWARASGVVRFCWAKCTTGNDPGVDAQFAANVAGCKAHGVPVGGYHFAYPLPDHPAHPGRSPEEQAERAHRDSGGLGSEPGELPHMVDAEWPAPTDATGAPWLCTRPQISDWLRRYCLRAAELWGRKPVIYTYPSWWRWLSQAAPTGWAAEYELVFADYDHPGPGTPRDGSEPSHMWWVSSTWTEWAAWQYSAEGSRERIPGINACPIDRDCIRDEETLARLCGLTASTVPAPANDTEPATIEGGTVHPLVPLTEPEPPEAA